MSWINWKNNSARCIRDYSIYTKEQLDGHREEITKLCEATNSRAYFHQARRDKHKVKYKMLECLTENIIHNKHSLSWIYRTACWHKTYSEKIWIIDLDDWWADRYEEVRLYINTKLRPEKEKVITTLETVNWKHLITSPFDLKSFKEDYPEVDVHRNNPTLLYYNKI